MSPNLFSLFINGIAKIKAERNVTGLLGEENTRQRVERNQEVLQADQSETGGVLGGHGR